MSNKKTRLATKITYQRKTINRLVDEISCMKKLLIEKDKKIRQKDEEIAYQKRRGEKGKAKDVDSNSISTDVNSGNNVVAESEEVEETVSEVAESLEQLGECGGTPQGSLSHSSEDAAPDGSEADPIVPELDGGEQQETSTRTEGLGSEHDIRGSSSPGTDEQGSARRLDMPRVDTGEEAEPTRD